MTAGSSASAIGSWPGTDPLEAQRTVLGELASSEASGSGGVDGVPHLVELPARGPGADIIGRTAALLVDLAVDLQPSGWRFTDAPGRDLQRARSFLRSDLDALAEAADGYRGPLKLQVAGPWTLAASVWLPRGERSVTDPGARRDVVSSLAEGVAGHVADVRRLVPGARVLLQLDEPSLPAVHAGRLPTASGFGRLPAVEGHELETGLQAVLVEAAEAGATETLVHCCARDVPFPVLRHSGAGALSLDVTQLGSRGWESVAVSVESDQRLWAGVVPTTGDLPSVSALVDAIRLPWRRVGLPLADLARITVTPTCGLAGASPGEARAALARTVEVARVVNEVAAEA